ncbi:hypothetical protein HK102_006829, partial [Quaeritorhiza haematococci]
GLAFSYFEAAYGIGSIIGPALGGYLANPVQQFPSLFGSSTLFRRFPYLLPCLVSSTVSILGFFIGLIFLEETLPSLRMKNELKKNKKGGLKNADSRNR